MWMYQAFNITFGRRRAFNFSSCFAALMRYVFKHAQIDPSIEFAFCATKNNQEFFIFSTMVFKPSVIFMVDRQMEYMAGNLGELAEFLDSAYYLNTVMPRYDLCNISYNATARETILYYGKESVSDIWKQEGF